VEEDVLQLEVLRGVDERPSRESNCRLRIDWSELPVPYADDAPLADMMQRYSCGKRAIYRQRRMMGISLRSSGNPDSGRSLTLAGSAGAEGGRRGTPRWLEAGGALACATWAGVDPANLPGENEGIEAILLTLRTRHAPERGDLCGPCGSAQGGTPGASGQWIAFNSDRNRYT